MSKMTLAQKIGQMVQAERQGCTHEDVKNYHLGSVMSGAGSLPENNDIESWLKTTDDYWKASTFEDEHDNYCVLYNDLRCVFIRVCTIGQLCDETLDTTLGATIWDTTRQ